MENSLKRGEREKELESQYLKAKRDKEKALKLLIQLIGKVRKYVYEATISAWTASGQQYCCEMYFNVF